MFKDIDTNIVSELTISTNESSCLVMGCIKRNMGRGMVVWNSLNNATCYFNSGTATCRKFALQQSMGVTCITTCKLDSCSLETCTVLG